MTPSPQPKRAREGQHKEVSFYYFNLANWVDLESEMGENGADGDDIFCWDTIPWLNVDGERWIHPAHNLRVPFAREKRKRKRRKRVEDGAFDEGKS